RRPRRRPARPLLTPDPTPGRESSVHVTVRHRWLTPVRRRRKRRRGGLDGERFARTPRFVAETAGYPAPAQGTVTGERATACIHFRSRPNPSSFLRSASTNAPWPPTTG